MGFPGVQEQEGGGIEGLTQHFSSAMSCGLGPGKRWGKAATAASGAGTEGDTTVGPTQPVRAEGGGMTDPGNGMTGGTVGGPAYAVGGSEWAKTKEGQEYQADPGVFMNRVGSAYYNAGMAVASAASPTPNSSGVITQGPVELDEAQASFTEAKNKYGAYKAYHDYVSGVQPTVSSVENPTLEITPPASGVKASAAHPIEQSELVDSKGIQLPVHKLTPQSDIMTARSAVWESTNTLLQNGFSPRDAAAASHHIAKRITGRGDILG